MFLIVDNERTPGAQNESTALLLAALRELHCDHEILKSDAVMEPNGFEPFVGVILSDGGLARGEEVSLSRFRLNFQTLLSTAVPILGIGTGARIIAEAYGGVVQHRDRFEEHDTTVELSNQSVLFDYLQQDTIRIKDDRADFIAKLPPHFELAARSERCPAHALQHRTRELYAMYFSVASAGDAGKTIIKNFLRYAGTAGGAL
jgi:GMP synthase-like glutamine amidotransferase